MDHYINQLNAWVAEQKPDYGDEDLDSLLDFLWRTYTELNPIQNDDIRRNDKALDAIMDSLPTEQSNRLFFSLCELCTLHEHQAFLDGIRLGVRLASELSAPA